MIRKIIVVCFLLISGLSFGQNLLLNYDFKTDLSGWTIPLNPSRNAAELMTDPPTGSAVWDAMDVMNDHSSGSALITNNSRAANTDMVVLSQCLPNTNDSYDWGTWVNIPDLQSTTGSVVIRYAIRLNSSDCTGGANAAAGYLYNQLGQWELFDGGMIDYPAGGTIEYVIAIRKTEAGGVFSAYIDDAFLLQADLIFEDSFDSFPTRTHW